MGVDLGGVQTGVAQDFLKDAGVHTVLEHQGGCRVAELVGRVEGGIQPSVFQAAVHHSLHGADGDPRLVVGREHSVGILALRGLADCQPCVQRFPAGMAEVHHALLAALTEDPHMVLTEILQVQTAELADAETTGDEQGQDRTVPDAGLAGPATVQKTDTLFLAEIVGEGLGLLRRLQLQAGVMVDEAALGEVAVEAPGGACAAATGGGGQAPGFARTHVGVQLVQVRGSEMVGGQVLRGDPTVPGQDIAEGREIRVVPVSGVVAVTQDHNLIVQEVLHKGVVGFHDGSSF